MNKKTLLDLIGPAFLAHEINAKPTEQIINDLADNIMKAYEQPDISEDVLEELGEKEVMISAFDKVREMFDFRPWIMQGRGSYPYNDDRYKEEVRYLFDEFDALQKDVWKNIKTKTFEYRDKIIENYKAEQPIPTVDEDELWNRVGAILNDSVSFSMYPKYLATLKQQFSITRK